MSKHQSPKDDLAVDMAEKVSVQQDYVHEENIDAVIQQLSRDSPPFWKNKNLLKLYIVMIPGCLVPSVTLGFDSAMMNGLQAVSTWQDYFNNPQGSVLGVLTAILSLGAICATPFLSFVGDRWGRRWGIMFGSIVMLCGGIIQGLSVHIGMFLLARFMLGFGIPFVNTFAPILIGELAHPKDRQVVTSLYQTSWYIGAIMAAWTTFGTFSMRSEWAWRIPSLLQALPALIQMCGIFLVPESPRWLIANGRGNEAKAVLTKYHANGEEGHRLVELEYAEMKAILEADMANETSWKSLVATRGNRRRMLLMIMLGLFSQWSGNGLVSYYLVRVLETVGISDNREKNIINGCLMIWNWFTAVSSALLTSKIKRRTQFLISTAGMLTVFAAQTLCAGLFNDHGDQNAGNGVIAMLFLFYTFYNLAYNALLYSYPVEVLPYHIRAKGFSVLMFCGKGANFVNALVNPIGLGAIGWKYYFVYVGWLCIETVCVYFFFVETKGPSLEAIAERFDKLDEKLS